MKLFKWFNNAAQGKSNPEKTGNLKTTGIESQESLKTQEPETPIKQKEPVKHISPEPTTGHYLTSPVVRREASQKELREINSELGLLHGAMQNGPPLTKQELAELEPRLIKHHEQLQEARSFTPKEKPVIEDDLGSDKEDSTLPNHQLDQHNNKELDPTRWDLLEQQSIEQEDHNPKRHEYIGNANEPLPEQSEQRLNDGKHIQPTILDHKSGSYEKPVTKDRIETLREQINLTEEETQNRKMDFIELHDEYKGQNSDLSFNELLNTHDDLKDAYYSYQDQEIQSQDWSYEADFHEDKLEAYSEGFREDWNKANKPDIPQSKGMEPATSTSKGMEPDV